MYRTARFVDLLEILIISNFCPLFVMSVTSKIQLSITENIAVGTIVTNLFDVIIPRPPLSTTKLTLMKNQFFTVEKRDRLVIINPIDRDNNPELCNYQKSNSYNTHPSTAKQASGYNQNCVWKSIIISNTGLIYAIEIKIFDVNDNTPQWTNSFYSVSITENSPVNLFSVQLPQATDPDEYPNNIVNYKINPTSKYVYISCLKKNNSAKNANNSGEIIPLLKLYQNIDRELLSWHNITVIAIDGGEISRTGTLMVTIKVVDTNDNTPTFESSIYQSSISKNLKINSLLNLKIRANDLDEGINSKIRYHFSLDVPFVISDCFAINSKLAILIIKKALIGNCYRPVYKFNLSATDNGNPPKSSKTTIILRMNHSLSLPPEIQIFKFRNPLTISENKLIKYEILTGFVKSSNSVKYYQIKCDLRGNYSNKFIFRLNRTKTTNISVFKIWTNSIFDREIIDHFSLEIICIYVDDSALSGIKIINIKILDENDNSPIFEMEEYKLEIFEENEPRQKIGQVRATDADTGVNSVLNYQIMWAANQTAIEPIGQLFFVSSQGEIFALKKLDRELYPEGLKFKVIATDHGEPALSGNCHVHIVLLDTNDNPPTFNTTQYNFTVNEDFGTIFKQRVIGIVKAEDKDLKNNSVIRYSMSHDAPLPFKLHPRSGQLITTSLIDREAISEHLYRFKVIATDTPLNLLFRKTAEITVQIYITDLNDNAPEFVQPNPKSEKPFLLSYQSSVGSLVVQIKAVDRDWGRNAQLEYQLVDPERNTLFSIDPNNGKLITSTVLTVVHEGTETLFIRVVDKGETPLSSLVKLTIKIGHYPIKYNKGVQSGDSEYGNNGDGIDDNSQSNFKESGSFLSDKATFVIVGMVLGTFSICCILVTGVCVISYRRWWCRRWHNRAARANATAAAAAISSSNSSSIRRQTGRLSAVSNCGGTGRLDTNIRPTGNDLLLSIGEATEEMGTNTLTTIGGGQILSSPSSPNCTAVDRSSSNCVGYHCGNRNCSIASCCYCYSKCGKTATRARSGGGRGVNGGANGGGDNRESHTVVTTQLGTCPSHPHSYPYPPYHQHHPLPHSTSIYDNTWFSSCNLLTSSNFPATNYALTPPSTGSTAAAAAAAAAATAFSVTANQNDLLIHQTPTALTEQNSGLTEDELIALSNSLGDSFFVLKEIIS